MKAYVFKETSNPEFKNLKEKIVLLGRNKAKQMIVLNYLDKSPLLISSLILRKNNYGSSVQVITQNSTYNFDVLGEIHKDDKGEYVLIKEYKTWNKKTEEPDDLTADWKICDEEYYFSVCDCYSIARKERNRKLYLKL